MSAAAIATIGTTIFVAFAGFVAAYFNNLRLTRRKDQLDRVSRQLSELYGPLLALESTEQSTWRLFRERYRPSGAFWDPDDPPSEDEARIWRLWMTTVFMPLNRKMVDVIRANGDLLAESDMPQCLLDVCAHVAAYEVVLTRWDADDFADHLGLANFPRNELHRYAVDSFTRLKAEQQHLLERKALGTRTSRLSMYALACTQVSLARERRPRSPEGIERCRRVTGTFEHVSQILVRVPDHIEHVCLRRQPGGLPREGDGFFGLTPLEREASPNRVRPDCRRDVTGRRVHRDREYFLGVLEATKQAEQASVE